MRALLKSFVADETGATAIEYGLIIALMAMGILAGVTSTGNSLSGHFESVGDQYNDINARHTP